MALSSELVMARDTSELPDDAFLEYLGEWESADGEWVDPLEFDDYELAEQGNEQACRPSDDKCLKQRRNKDES